MVRKDGVSKGCAFIKFFSRASAVLAIHVMHDTVPEGTSRPLVVKWADDRKQIRPGLVSDPYDFLYPTEELKFEYAQPSIFHSDTPRMSPDASYLQQPCTLSQDSLLLRSEGGMASKPIEGPPGANLFVYHIPRELNDADLMTLFNPFGKILSAKVYVDKKTEESKG